MPLLSCSRRAALRLAVLLAWPGAVLAQTAVTLESVMAALAARRSGEAGFTESKEIPELDAPLRSTGTLAWAAPDRLEKHTLAPVEEILRVEGDRLFLARPAQNLQRSMGLDDVPEIRPLVESIRATLAGDLATLQRHFEIGFRPEGTGWRMWLTPRSLRVRAALQSVEITGRGGELTSLLTRGNEGTTRLVITPPPASR
ncbi:outer membrane lipoprotein carrier protein LolA [Roseomonas sp. E05]|uniref:LolA family protein n=1 Tax=Roseomonas sp. E05 TaxID=3046310 RepID=UPI0024BB71D3|nr:outer membrane lipoprotein carrier protein LolA [Roseomonas sp. E05]MDJ0389536.1 outer membrane lipoprotein carrier protein LolA [Roseomonas sp. E05]